MVCIRTNTNVGKQGLHPSKSADSVLPLFPSPDTARGEMAACFDHGDTGDVKLAIRVVQSDENDARRQLHPQGTVCETVDADLCVHAETLMCNSPVWKAQLERWQGADEPKRITMIVEEGEQAAAHRLVQYLYTKCLPAIKTDLDMRVHLGVLMLADQYQIDSALSLCAQKIEMLTDLGAISWDLADRVLQLPVGYLEKAGFSCLLLKIQEKILQHVAAETSLPGVGLDLEVVMRNSGLEKALMALPLRECASLLRDDRCRVPSENTVATAVLRRLDAERSGSGGRDVAHDQSMDFMTDVIRVPHLSSLYAAALPAFASQLTSVFPPEMYVLGRELDALRADVRERLAEQCSIPRSWLSGCRLPSTLSALEFEWEVSAAELADAFDKGWKNLSCSPRYFFAGMDWGVLLQPRLVLENGGRTLGVYVSGRYPLLKEGPPYGAVAEVNVVAPDEKSSRQRKTLCSTTAGTSWGWANYFCIPPMEKWDQSCMQEWTSPNGFLTLRVKISDVM